MINYFINGMVVAMYVVIAFAFVAGALAIWAIPKLWMWIKPIIYAWIM